MLVKFLQSFKTKSSFLIFLFSCLIASTTLIGINACKPDEDFTPLVLDCISPTEVSPGDTLTIYGKGFGPILNQYSIGFGQEAESDVDPFEVKPGYIKVVVPNDVQEGPVYVKIFKEVASTTCSLKLRPVVINSIEPSSAYVGDTITINGEGLSLNAEVVYLGEGRIRDFVERTRSKIRVVVPGEATTGKVKVLGTEGPEFKLNPGVIESITPMEGPVGTVVTIKGKGFDMFEGVNALPFVSFGEKQIGDLRQLIKATSTEIKVKVPNESTTAKIFVNGGSMGNIESKDVFKVTASIFSIVPREVAKGDLITITGSGFAFKKENNDVFLGNIKLKPESVERDERLQFVLKVKVPDDVPEDSIDVKIQTLFNGAVFGTTNTVKIKVRSAGAPNISSISPSAEIAGKTINIKGINFGTSPTVLFDETPASNVITNIDGSLDVIVPAVPVPAGTNKLTVDITVKNNDNGLADTQENAFDLISEGIIITKVTDQNGNLITSASTKDIIIIHGQNFDHKVKTQVYLKGFKIETYSPPSSSTELFINIPENAQAGTNDIEVRVFESLEKEPRSSLNEGEIKVLRDPVVYGLDKKTGTINSVIKIGIVGESIDPGDFKVYFGDKISTATISGASINAMVPDGVPIGTPLNIKVVSQGKEKVATDQFTVVNAVTGNETLYLAKVAGSSSIEMHKGIISVDIPKTQLLFSTTSENLVTAIHSLIVDIARKKMYWVETNDDGSDKVRFRIRTGDTNGKYKLTLYQTDFKYSHENTPLLNLVLDDENGKLYWTEIGSKAIIYTRDTVYRKNNLTMKAQEYEIPNNYKPYLSGSDIGYFMLGPTNRELYWNTGSSNQIVSYNLSTKVATPVYTHASGAILAFKLTRGVSGSDMVVLGEREVGKVSGGVYQKLYDVTLSTFYDVAVGSNKEHIYWINSEEKVVRGKFSPAVVNEGVEVIDQFQGFQSISTGYKEAGVGLRTSGMRPIYLRMRPKK